MAFSFMFSLFALFIFLFLVLLKFFESEKRELPLDPPGTLGWPYIRETFWVDSQNPNVFLASEQKRYGSIVSNIESIAKDSLTTASQEMHRAGLVDFLKSMKKLGRLLMKARPLTLTLLLLSAKAEGKTPTLEYGIIGKAPPSRSTHPPPINDPTRRCNAENYCRHFTLSAISSGTRVEAFAMVNVGAPLNSTAPGLEAIAGGIATWSLNDKKSGRLRVLMNATADANSTLVSQLKLAVSRGIALKGLDVQYRNGSISSEEMATLSPADGNITITVGAASNWVELEFMTYVDSFGETDVKWIQEYAKANILAGGQ